MLAPAVRPGAKLGDGAEQWATQLTLLALQCIILLPQAELPAWLQALSQPLGEHTQLELPVIVQRSHSLSLHCIVKAETGMIAESRAGEQRRVCAYSQLHSAHRRGVCDGRLSEAGTCHLSS